MTEGRRPSWPLWIALGVTVATGFALYAPGSFGLTYRLGIIAHPLAGLVCAVLCVRAVGAHVRHRVTRAAWRWPAFVEGVVAVGAWGVTVATGFVLIAHALGFVEAPLFKTHGDAALATLALAAIHSLRLLLRHPESRRPFAVAMALMLLVSGGVAALMLLPSRGTASATIVAGGAGAPSGGAVTPSTFDHLDTAGCAVCHPGVVADHARSAHAVSFRSNHFAAIQTLLKKEQPQAMGFCTGCHYPATESGLATADSPGVHCLTCHAARDVERTGPFGSRIHLALPQAHLDLLAEAAREARAAPAGGRASGFALTLLRAAAPAHGRSFSPNAGDNKVCLSCHGLYIPEETAPQFFTSRCTDCHMAGQRDLLDQSTPDHLPHLFAGSNVAMHESVGDKSMSATVRRWLQGDLLFDYQLRFWSFDSNERPRNKAAWVTMSLAPSGTPRPGEPLSVAVETTNVGIGHPFPSAPQDLVRVRLRGGLIARDGRVLWRVPDDFPPLGGVMVADGTGLPLEGHRLWVSHHNVGDPPIARGQTVSRTITTQLPTSPGDYPARLSLRWEYTDLADPFRAFAGMPPESSTDPQPVIASTQMVIPFPTAEKH